MNIWEILGYLGIPSAVIGAILGLAIWRLKKWLEKKEKRDEKRSEIMTELLMSNVSATDAALSLGEATAKAVQRIPDAHCNGDMSAALDYANKVKHERRDMLQKLGVQSAVS